MVGLEAYKRFLTGEKKSAVTVKYYLTTAGGYLRWLDGGEVALKTAEEYLMDKAPSVKASSLSTFTMAIRTFLRYHGVELRRGQLRCRRVDTVREDKFLTLEEVNRLVEASNNLRDKCIFRVLYHTGVRATELLNIMVEDIDYDKQRINIKGLKKSHKVRSVRAIRPELVFPTIRAYLMQRRAVRGEPLVCKLGGFGGGRMCYGNLRRIVRGYAGVVGKPDLSPHWFRHGFVVLNKTLNVPAEICAMQIGDTVETTVDIYSHFSQCDVDRVYDALEGRGAAVVRERDVVDEIGELREKAREQDGRLGELESANRLLSGMLSELEKRKRKS